MIKNSLIYSPYFFFFVLFFVIAFHSPSSAEELKTSNNLPIAEGLRDINDVFTIAVENDLFGKGTDQNYTSGVRFGYLNTNAKFPKIAHKIARLIPTFDINETTSVFYSFGQNLYTPDDITQSVQPANDRPWSAYLYASIGMVSLTNGHIDEAEFSLGVVGPWALGEQTQKFIHKHVSNSPTPQGWDNQLSNEPALLLAWQRRWPEFKTTQFLGLRTSASPYFGVTVGNVYTFANTGLNLRFGPNSERYQDTPIRVRPAIPGTGFFQIPKKRWSWFLFSGMEARAIGRNIFLDGNTFRSSHDIDKRYFVGDLNAGLALTYNKVRISYTLNHRTKEFKGQDDPDLFGALSFGYRF